PDSAIGVLISDVSNDKDVLSEEFARAAVDVDAKSDKPVIIGHHWTHLMGRELLTRLAQEGTISIEGTENLFLAIRHAFAYRDFRALPPVAAPAAPAAGVVARWRKRLMEASALDEAESLALLADFGIPNPGIVVANSLVDVQEAARKL